MEDFRDFPCGPVVKTELPLQGAHVRSPGEEPRSCVPCGAAKKKRKKRIGRFIEAIGYPFSIGHILHCFSLTALVYKVLLFGTAAVGFCSLFL